MVASHSKQFYTHRASCVSRLRRALQIIVGPHSVFGSLSNQNSLLIFCFVFLFIGALAAQACTTICPIRMMSQQKARTTSCPDSSLCGRCPTSPCLCLRPACLNKALHLVLLLQRRSLKSTKVDRPRSWQVILRPMQPILSLRRRLARCPVSIPSVSSLFIGSLMISRMLISTNHSSTRWHPLRPLCPKHRRGHLSRVHHTYSLDSAQPQ